MTMRRSAMFAGFVLAAFLVPALGYAGFATDTLVEVHLSEQRVGDVYRYHFSEVVRPAEGQTEARFTSDNGVTTVVAVRSEETTGVQLLRFEGASTSVDRFGRIVDVDAHHIETYDKDGLVDSVRCLSLRGSESHVRTERLDGGLRGESSDVHTNSGVLILGVGSRSRQTEHTTTFAEGRCFGFPLRVDSRLVEGETYRFADLFDGVDEDINGDARSQPAQATTFHGRPALAVRFDVTHVAFGFPFAGSIQLVYANGLPVVAEAEFGIEHTTPEGITSYSSRVALEGFAPGDGAVRAPPTRHAPPTPPGFAPYGRLSFDDAAFRLPYPYAEAYAALVQDSMVGLASWLAQHPDAYLYEAEYDRAREPRQGSRLLQTEGGWTMTFRDLGAVYKVETVRARAPGPLGVVPVVENRDHGEPWMGPFFGHVRSSPESVARSGSIAAVAERLGVERQAIGSLTFSIEDALLGDETYARLEISQVAPSQQGRAEGIAIGFDLLDGGATYVANTKQVNSDARLGPLAGGGSVAMPGGKLMALSALVGPMPGAGLAGGAAAATGLALLLLALKFGLVPFYSRLVRDRLLDNPVRAALFDRVRREPGIRRAELIEFAGVGEGATRRHLDQLARHGFLVEMHEGFQVSYYASGDVPPALARRAAILRSESTRRVYELLASEPRLSLREAGARLGMSAPGVHRIKKKLEKAGLLPAATDPVVVVG